MTVKILLFLGLFFHSVRCSETSSVKASTEGDDLVVADEANAEIYSDIVLHMVDGLISSFKLNSALLLEENLFELKTYVEPILKSIHIQTPYIELRMTINYMLMVFIFLVFFYRSSLSIYKQDK
jgi:hypothetical protein